MAVSYWKLNVAYERLMAVHLVQTEIYLVGDYCAEDFTRNEDDYEISLVNDGESRAVSATWKSFWDTKQVKLSFLNPIECRN